MIIADAHCDTISKLIEKRENLYYNSCHIDIKRLTANNTRYGFNHVQFFAAYSGLSPKPEQCKAYIINQIKMLKKEISSFSGLIMQCYNSGDINNSIKNNKIAAILSIEGLNYLNTELDSEEDGFLQSLKENGVKMAALSWNFPGSICSTCYDKNDFGLSNQGKKLIKYLNQKNIIIDVSHASEKTFFDVIESTSKPIAASHSNSKELCSHKRNLTNEQIKSIAHNRGIICINFYRKFLNSSRENGSKTAGITEIIRNIEHISSLAGTDHVGIGSDYDGMEYPAYDIPECSQIYKLVDALIKLNYNIYDIENIMGKNIIRVIKSNEFDEN